MTYSNPMLIESIYQKTISYRGVRYWPEMAYAKFVLDFGGGFGIHYIERASHTVRWAIVEQEAIVERAEDIVLPNLKFFKTIPEALEWLGKPDVIHCNGALQYTPDPIKVLYELIEIKADKMLWYRTPLSNGEIIRTMQKSRLADNGPGKGRFIDKFRTIEYERTIIPKEIFMNAHKEYTLLKNEDDNYHFNKGSEICLMN